MAKQKQTVADREAVLEQAVLDSLDGTQINDLFEELEAGMWRAKDKAEAAARPGRELQARETGEKRRSTLALLGSYLAQGGEVDAAMQVEAAAADAALLAAGLGPGVTALLGRATQLVSDQASEGATVNSGEQPGTTPALPPPPLPVVGGATRSLLPPLPTPADQAANVARPQGGGAARGEQSTVVLPAALPRTPASPQVASPVAVAAADEATPLTEPLVALRTGTTNENEADLLMTEAAALLGGTL